MSQGGREKSREENLGTLRKPEEGDMVQKIFFITWSTGGISKSQESEVGRDLWEPPDQSPAQSKANFSQGGDA